MDATLTAEHHLAPATIRGYQSELRLGSGPRARVRAGDAPGADLS